MAYESYSFVSWTDATPITSTRLQQMSTNISQVKDATDDNPKGIIKYTVRSNTATAGANVFAPIELISLKLEGNGSDNRVTVAGSRYYRINLSFPGFSVQNAGGEDSVYYVSLKQGIFGSGVPTVHANYKFSSAALTYINTADAVANINNEAIRNTAYPMRFGAGTISVVVPSGLGFTNKSFFAEVGKVQGLSNNNATSYSIIGSETPIQLYIEDIGGAI